MSVLIKDMERPKDCWHCRFADPEEGGCLVDQKSHGDWDEPDDCPLVSVPPHGRLGDLDRLERMFADIDNAPYSGFDGEESFYSADDAARIIRLAPTIIPADIEEEE